VKTAPFAALALVALFALAADATSPDPPPPQPATGAAPLADDPGCVGKYKGQLCQMADGAGGLCGPSRCGPQSRPCLRCMPAQRESAGLDIWVPMLSFGALVAIVGSVFWFRLRKSWGPSHAPTAPRDPRAPRG
jgi:hypothetical protein